MDSPQYLSHGDIILTIIILIVDNWEALTFPITWKQYLAYFGYGWQPQFINIVFTISRENKRRNLGNYIT